jgi:inosine/xanthosine triphosphatase
MGVGNDATKPWITDEMSSSNGTMSGNVSVQEQKCDGGNSDGVVISPPARTATSASNVLRVAVGTSNPAKLRAVEQALRRAILRNNAAAAATTSDLEVNVQGFDVESGVSNQPFGNDETRTGARNRAVAAYRAYRQSLQVAPHLAIGLEGGLEWVVSDTGENSDGKNNGHLYCMAWIVLYGRRTAATVQALACADTEYYVGDKKPIFGQAKTAMFPIPDSVANHVKEGLELGDADDLVFQRVNSKHQSGTVGILTDDLIDRSAYYEHAILLALSPWIRPNLFPDGVP